MGCLRVAQLSSQDNETSLELRLHSALLWQGLLFLCQSATDIGGPAPHILAVIRSSSWIGVEKASITVTVWLSWGDFVLHRGKLSHQQFLKGSSSSWKDTLLDFTALFKICCCFEFELKFACVWHRGQCSKRVATCIWTEGRNWSWAAAATTC